MMTPVSLFNILLVAFILMGGTPKPPKWHMVTFYAVVASL
jgi:hypothetical protein